ncbi:DUF4097 family beta strand repeat-containing protein [Catalinimonas niigatensis]|uniref:DUF4097 family beta strand repeat-containing protein n=1 Tax=Catalinimonas niigatensis TaxID=1397264 RepID=UPI0026663FC8|nr:DUF4097 family beta strand repeat-containing protein [Catalinimonas niigatensis]WPP51537.1 DUF4097 family beta strand repeat-containing protein [Catalinimonas niigatensis]
MKIIKLVLLSFLLIPFSLAQEYKTSFDSNSASNRLNIMIEGGAIEVQGYSGNELIITADGYEAPPEKAKGLLPLYANNKEDNSGIGLSVSKNGNEIQITSVGHQDVNYIIKVPNQSFLKMNAGPQNDALRIENMKGEIEVKAHSDDVVMEGINGPVVANSISGNMKLTFDEITTDKPIMVSVVSGDIDLIMPSTTKADFKLSSISGEVYTDFDMAMKQKEQEGERYGMRKPINGSINGGGSPIHISTVSGNIYLRKE